MASPSYDKAMTKQQSIETVSTNSGQPKAEVDAVVESVLGAITEALRNDERINLRGFGSFRVKETKLDASFKPGRELSEKIGRAQTETVTT